MFETFVRLYSNWQNRYEAARSRKSTIDELSKLNDKDLEDIGINRGDIRFIADKHYKDIREEYFRDIKARADMINSNLRGWV